jgi:hypothetical protein
MQRVSMEATISYTSYKDIGIILAFAVAAIMLGAATLRRQTK